MMQAKPLQCLDGQTQLHIFQVTIICKRMTAVIALACIILIKWTVVLHANLFCHELQIGRPVGRELRPVVELAQGTGDLAAADAWDSSVAAQEPLFDCASVGQEQLPGLDRASDLKLSFSDPALYLVAA